MQENHKKLFWIGSVLLVVLAIYFGVKTVKEISGDNDNTYNTITVSGHGEVTAAPDIANIYLTLRGEAKTVAEAQAKVAENEGKALEVLRANEIEDKDIKTESASFNPKYEYTYDYMLSRPGKQTVVGYEAYETISVKIRDIDSTGKVMEELGRAGVSELSGPNFAIDEEEGLKAEARKAAIEEAKAKAKVLAKDLGARLGDVVSFSESGDGFYPMYDSAVMGMGKAESSVSAELPKGENLISSDVTITYEIK